MLRLFRKSLTGLCLQTRPIITGIKSMEHGRFGMMKETLYTLCSIKGVKRPERG